MSLTFKKHCRKVDCKQKNKIMSESNNALKKRKTE